MRAIIEGRAAFLLIDVQDDYFNADRLRVRGTSPEAQEHMPKVGKRITAAITQFDRHCPKIARIFMVHAWNKQLRHMRERGSNLACELTAPVRPHDNVFSKLKLCSFYDTPLAHHAREQGIDTFFVGGGVLEECLATGLDGGLWHEGFNMVLMPDLTASKNKLDEDAIREIFRDPSLQKQSSNPTNWAGVLSSSQIINLARRAQLQHTHVKQPLTAMTGVPSV